jgi:hypothetical protein
MPGCPKLDDISQFNHVYVDGVCSKCGAAEVLIPQTVYWCMMTPGEKCVIKHFPHPKAEDLKICMKGECPHRRTLDRVNRLWQENETLKKQVSELMRRHGVRSL